MGSVLFFGRIGHGTQSLIFVVFFRGGHYIITQIVRDMNPASVNFHS